ncbi:MAG: hypothetical protein AABY93_08835 [Bacteroidota bacterium]
MKTTGRKIVPIPSKSYSDFIKKHPEVGKLHEKIGDAARQQWALNKREVR